jgi:hypothetical protein
VNSLAAETRIEAECSSEGLADESGSDEQHERERELRDDDRRSRP